MMAIETRSDRAAATRHQSGDAQALSRLELGHVLAAVSLDLQPAFDAARQQIGETRESSKPLAVRPMRAAIERPARGLGAGGVAAVSVMALLVAGVGLLGSGFLNERAASPTQSDLSSPTGVMRPSSAAAAPAAVAISAPPAEAAGAGSNLVQAPPTPPRIATAAARPSDTPRTARRVQQGARPTPSPPSGRNLAAAAPASTAALAGCEGDNCSYAGVLAADRRLRQYYAMAVDAGVPNAVLRQYRNRWSDLQDNAAATPGQTVREYGVLGEDLARAASRYYE